jgi:hypothetical protein
VKYTFCEKVNKYTFCEKANKYTFWKHVNKHAFRKYVNKYTFWKHVNKFAIRKHKQIYILEVRRQVYTLWNMYLALQTSVDSSSRPTKAATKYYTSTRPTTLSLNFQFMRKPWTNFGHLKHTTSLVAQSLIKISLAVNIFYVTQRHTATDRHRHRDRDRSQPSNGQN